MLSKKIILISTLTLCFLLLDARRKLKQQNGIRNTLMN